MYIYIYWTSLLVDILLRKLKQILHKLKLQSFLGNGCEIDVSYVRGVRDWKGWLLGYALCFETQKVMVHPYSLVPVQTICYLRMKPLGISFHGGLRDDCSGMHLFLFFKRKGWTICTLTCVMLMFVFNRSHYRFPISHAPDP